MGNQGVKKYNLNHTNNKMKWFSVCSSCVYFIWSVCESVCCLWYVCMLCLYVMFVVCVCMICMGMYMHIYCLSGFFLTLSELTGRENVDVTAQSDVKLASVESS